MKITLNAANAAGHSSDSSAAGATVLTPGQLAPRGHARASFPGPRADHSLVANMRSTSRHGAFAARAPAAGVLSRQAAAAPEPATAREHFLAGVRAYWAHPYRRRPTESRVLWRTRFSAGCSTLAARGRLSWCSPRLINRAEMLDLLPGRSLLEYLAASGYRPLLLDWGVPRGRELRFTLSEHIHGRAAGALDTVLANRLTESPFCIGYCLGGLLATGLAAARPDDLAGLAVLATPWAFRGAAHRCPSRPPSLLRR